LNFFHYKGIKFDETYTSLKNLGAVNNVEVAEKVDVFAPTIQTVNEEGVLINPI
jgi:hypothetical protein